jgi:hypothetical protein
MSPAEARKMNELVANVVCTAIAHRGYDGVALSAGKDGPGELFTLTTFAHFLRHAIEDLHTHMLEEVRP